MTKKRYKVPYGMLKAVHDASRNFQQKLPEGFYFYPLLEAALGWLLDDIERLEFCSDDYKNFRSMFLAPKPEDTAYGRMTKAMGAVTLSREEGNRIIEYVKGAIHDGSSKPEVPEAVKDLLPFPPEIRIADDDLYRSIRSHLDRVAAEAYRRGQESR